MNICALFGGPHKKGHTATLLENVLEGARSAGHATRRLDVADMDIRPCKGCMGCKRPKAAGCVQHDDMGQVYDAVREADVLILATPMYWWNLAGPLKNVVDRFFALPFNAAIERSAFAGKQLMLVMTSGQPAASDGREGLERILTKMCAFTGMTWRGTVTAGTGATPLDEQPQALNAAREAGAAL
jgi:multimeric flavodoxin WrbA